ncbi:MAG: hypothetical protein V4736_10220 [Bdellovibrionota bacterium]
MKEEELTELSKDFATDATIGIAKVLNLPAEEEEKVKAAIIRAFDYILKPYF